VSSKDDDAALTCRISRPYADWKEWNKRKFSFVSICSNEGLLLEVLFMVAFIRRRAQAKAD
jgi:hypothetical protein